MTETFKAWQCVGCGRIEAPQPCIGVCQDRRVDFVYAEEHRAALDLAERRAAALVAFARRFAATHPRDGGFEASFRAFQGEARRALAGLEPGDPAATK